MSFMPSDSPATVGSPSQPRPETSSLRQACFWTGLRQEIVMAFVNQRPVKMRLDHSFIDRSLAPPAADDVWANRIILHCADVLRYCFGTGGEATADDWLRLKAHDDAWLRARPPSWLPVAYAEPDRDKGEVFPTILYLSGPIGESWVGGESRIYRRNKKTTWTELTRRLQSLEMRMPPLPGRC